MLSAKEIIKKLNLQRLEPEGGYFKRNCEIIKDSSVITSCIYYLLEATDLSAMHRLKSDEVYHFYMGDPLEILELFPDGSAKKTILGNDLENNMVMQFKVAKGVWQGSIVLANKYGYSLVGTTMSPEYREDGFELADEKLLEKYPSHKEAIVRRMHK